MRLLYVLPRHDYFQRGRNGRVTHAAGVVQGLSQCGVDVTVVSGIDTIVYCKSALRVREIHASFPFVWYLKLLFVLPIEGARADFIVIRYSFKFGWLITIIMRAFFGNRWGFELNSFGYMNLQQGAALRALLRQIELYFIRFAPFVNCVSESLLSELPRQIPTRLVIPNAGSRIDRAFAGRPIVHFDGKSSSDLKLVYLGNFHEYYSLKEAAIALSDIEKVQLHLYGDGKQSRLLKRIAAQSRSVFVHGRYCLTDLLLSGTLTGKTFLFLPYKAGSLAEYGSPMKLFEYLSIGLPILSTRVGQPYHVLRKLQEECTGSAVFYEDEQQLRRIVSEISQVEYKYDPECIRQHFSIMHTWQARMKQYVDAITAHIHRFSTPTSAYRARGWARCLRLVRIQK